MGAIGAGLGWAVTGAVPGDGHRQLALEEDPQRVTAVAGIQRLVAGWCSQTRMAWQCYLEFLTASSPYCES